MTPETVYQQALNAQTVKAWTDRDDVPEDVIEHEHEATDRCEVCNQNKPFNEIYRNVGICNRCIKEGKNHD